MNQIVHYAFSLTIALSALLLLTVMVWVMKSAIRDMLALGFKRADLMNASEARLFRYIQDELPFGWMVMAQVSYGAFLRHRLYSRYRDVMCKRADFVVVDASLRVAAVLEYHGGGHYGKSRRDRNRARQSDTIKRDAMSQAGIAYIELPAEAARNSIQQALQSIDCSPSVSAALRSNSSNNEVPNVQNS